MLKPYDNQADIPDEFKEHYSRREDGKWHADIPNDHPAVKHSATLLSEKQTAEEKARTAEAALASAQASGLPRGHVAVPKADADFLEKVKAHGTPEEVEKKLTGFDSLSTKVAKQERREGFENIRKALKWNEDAPDVLDLIQDLPDVVWQDGKDKEGKDAKVPMAKVKTGENTFADKPFEDYLKEAYPALHRSVLPASSAGTRVLGSPAGGGASPKTSIVDDFIEKRDAAAASKPSPFRQKAAPAA